MEDRRHFPRTRCFKGATITAPGQAVACIVRNVSAEGAGLQLSYSVTSARPVRPQLRYRAADAPLPRHLAHVSRGGHLLRAASVS